MAIKDTNTVSGSSEQPGISAHIGPNTQTQQLFQQRLAQVAPLPVAPPVTTPVAPGPLMPAPVFLDPNAAQNKPPSPGYELTPYTPPEIKIPAYTPKPANQSGTTPGMNQGAGSSSVEGAARHNTALSPTNISVLNQSLKQISKTLHLELLSPGAQLQINRAADQSGINLSSQYALGLQTPTDGNHLALVGSLQELIGLFSQAKNAQFFASMLNAKASVTLKGIEQRYATALNTEALNHTREHLKHLETATAPGYQSFEQLYPNLSLSTVTDRSSAWKNGIGANRQTDRLGAGLDQHYVLGYQLPVKLNNDITIQVPVNLAGPLKDLAQFFLRDGDSWLQASGLISNKSTGLIPEGVMQRYAAAKANAGDTFNPDQRSENQTGSTIGQQLSSDVDLSVVTDEETTIPTELPNETERSPFINVKPTDPDEQKQNTGVIGLQPKDTIQPSKPENSAGANNNATGPIKASAADQNPQSNPGSSEDSDIEAGIIDYLEKNPREEITVYILLYAQMTGENVQVTKNGGSAPREIAGEISNVRIEQGRLVFNINGQPFVADAAYSTKLMNNLKILTDEAVNTIGSNEGGVLNIRKFQLMERLHAASGLPFQIKEIMKNEFAGLKPALDSELRNLKSRIAPGQDLHAVWQRFVESIQHDHPYISEEDIMKFIQVSDYSGKGFKHFILRQLLADYVARARGDGEAPDLRGLYLRQVDLSGMDFSGADFSGAYLGFVNLTAADLTKVNFTGATLKSVNLDKADLREAILNDASYGSANITPQTYMPEIEVVEERQVQDIALEQDAFTQAMQRDGGSAKFGTVAPLLMNDAQKQHLVELVNNDLPLRFAILIALSSNIEKELESAPVDIRDVDLNAEYTLDQQRLILATLALHELEMYHKFYDTMDLDESVTTKEAFTRYLMGRIRGKLEALQQGEKVQRLPVIGPGYVPQDVESNNAKSVQLPAEVVRAISGLRPNIAPNSVVSAKFSAMDIQELRATVADLYVETGNTGVSDAELEFIRFAYSLGMAFHSGVDDLAKPIVISQVNKQAQSMSDASRGFMHQLVNAIQHSDSPEKLEWAINFYVSKAKQNQGLDDAVRLLDLFLIGLKHQNDNIQ